MVHVGLHVAFTSLRRYFHLGPSTSGSAVIQYNKRIRDRTAEDAQRERDERVRRNVAPDGNAVLTGEVSELLVTINIEGEGLAVETFRSIVRFFADQVAWNLSKDAGQAASAASPVQSFLPTIQMGTLAPSHHEGIRGII